MPAPKPRLKVTSVPLDDLSPWPGNARRGVVAKIKESMLVNGVFHPVDVQASTGKIIAGNHRYKALLELHAEEPDNPKWGPNIDVIMHDVNDARALKMHLADNKTADDATWNEEALAAQLQSLVAEEDGLEGTGFDEDELEDLIDRLTADEGAPGAADLLTAGEDVYDATYAINVVLPGEAEQERLYRELSDRGFEVKVVTV